MGLRDPIRVQSDRAAQAKLVERVSSMENLNGFDIGRVDKKSPSARRSKVLPPNKVL